MKYYGAKKATEFTKKQIGVIYAKAKSGELKVEKWIISRLYDLADYFGYDDGGSVAQSEGWILRILDKTFANDLEEAQHLIDHYTEISWRDLGRISREKADRSLQQ